MSSPQRSSWFHHSRSGLGWTPLFVRRRSPRASRGNGSGWGIRRPRRDALLVRGRLDVVLCDAIRDQAARLLAQAAALQGDRTAVGLNTELNAGEERWLSELFGDGLRHAVWMRDSQAFVARAQRVPRAHRIVVGLVQLMQTARWAWPSRTELADGARSLSDSAEVAVLALEAYLRAGRLDLAQASCEDVLYTCEDTGVQWRAWSTLGHLHFAGQRRGLACAAFEAAANLEGCSVVVLVESLAANLALGDSAGVRRAAARLELLTSPGCADFVEALARLTERDSSWRCSRSKMESIIGSRPSASAAVLDAIA